MLSFWDFKNNLKEGVRKEIWGPKGVKTKVDKV
jgi:hypothetical protein